MPKRQSSRSLLRILQEDTQKEDQGGAGQGQDSVGHAQHRADRQQKPLQVLDVGQGDWEPAGQLSTRTNVMLQNEEHSKLSNKFVQMKHALHPRSKLVSRSTSQCTSRICRLEIQMARANVNKMTTSTMGNPYLTVTTADMGHMSVGGLEHLLSAPHRDCDGLRQRHCNVCPEGVLWVHQGQVRGDREDPGSQKDDVRDRGGYHS